MMKEKNFRKKSKRRITIFYLLTSISGKGHLVRSKIIKDTLQKFVSQTTIELVNYPTKDLKSEYDFVIADIREESLNLLKKIKYRKAIILDSLKQIAISNVKYIYTLPMPNSKNDDWLKYLILQKENYISNSHKENIFLISFGGTDPHKLSLYLLKEIIVYGDVFLKLYKEIKFIVINDELYEIFPNKRIKMQNVEIHILPFSKKFLKILSISKVVITSFGNTLFEALLYKKVVFLIGHSSYHNLLSQTTYGIIGGFVNLGVYKDVSLPLMYIYEFLEKNNFPKLKREIPKKGNEKLCLDILSFFY